MATYLDPATALRIAREARAEDIRRAEAHRVGRRLAVGARRARRPPRPGRGRWRIRPARWTTPRPVG